MTKTYIQIVKQIEALKAEAEKVRKNEISGVIKRIREAIEHYGLSAQDLGLAQGGAPATKAAAAAPKKRQSAGKKAASAAREVKFRDEAGNTWGGRGKRPQWLRDALSSGKQLQDFLVK